MHQSLAPSRWSRLVFFFVIAGTMLGLVRAQNEGTQAYEALTANEKIRLQTLRDGKEQPASEDDRKLIDKAAKFYANRLTYPDFHVVTTDPNKPTMSKLVAEAVQQIVQTNDPNQQAYVKEFGKAMTANLKKVVRNTAPIARVNGARLLAQLALTGQEDAADTLLEVLKDPTETEGVKLWALRGLRDYFAGRQPPKPREPVYIAALLDYLQHKAKQETPLPAEEEAALRYLRRETIRALGQTRHPGIDEGGKFQPTAWWLLKVACRDASIKPDPSLSEQLEAARGACQLDPKLAKDAYNADYTAHLVVVFTLDFLSAYNNRNSLPSPNTGLTFPWKVLAVQFEESLDKFQAAATGTPSAAVVTNTVAQCKMALAPVHLGANSASPDKLEAFLTQSTPSNTTLFKALPDSTVKVPGNR